MERHKAPGNESGINPGIIASGEVSVFLVREMRETAELEIPVVARDPEDAFTIYLQWREEDLAVPVMPSTRLNAIRLCPVAPGSRPGVLPWDGMRAFNQILDRKPQADPMILTAVKIPQIVPCFFDRGQNLPPDPKDRENPDARLEGPG